MQFGVEMEKQLKTHAFVALVSGLLCVPVHSDEVETLEWSFVLEENGRVSLENVSGDVTILGVDGRNVEIKAVKRADSASGLEGLEIVIDSKKDMIRIETEYPDSGLSGLLWWNKSEDGQVDYTLRVPRDSNLDAISSVNGSIRIAQVGGTVIAKTVNGGIEASEIVSDARLETVNGSVKARFSQFDGNQKAKIESVNGRLSVMLPGDADCTVEAETINGSINGSDFDLAAEQGFVGHDLSGVIGSGSARLSLDTVNGGIKLLKD